MDSFEWNKFAGWLLAASIAVLALSIVSGIVFAPQALKSQSYVIEGVVAEGGALASVKTVDKPIEFYMASASPEKGANIFKKCASCHTITPGGPAGIGPNLYGVVGGPHDHMPGFGYSDAMMKFKGQAWDWTALNAWLSSPKAYAPGTKMAFAGISKIEDRASVIAYLNSQSAKPLPMPAVPAEVAPAVAAAVAGAPAAAGAAVTVAPAAAAGAKAAPAAAGVAKAAPAAASVAAAAPAPAAAP